MRFNRLPSGGCSTPTAFGPCRLDENHTGPHKGTCCNVITRRAYEQTFATVIQVQKARCIKIRDHEGECG